MEKTAARILAELKARGIAATTFGELFDRRGDCDWSEVASIADDFAKSHGVRRAESEYRHHFVRWLAMGRPKDRVPKDYVLCHEGERPRLPAGDKLFRLGLDRSVRTIINAYLGCRSSLRQYDLFCNLPLRHPERRRFNAQCWHRDRWNQIKLFLYFSPVDHETGALEYIPESRRGGRYAGLWPFGQGDGPPGYMQPPQELVARWVPAEARTCCPLPRGSLLFCDTSGLHRANLVESTKRVLACWAYYPPSARVARNFRCRARPVEA